MIEPGLYKHYKNKKRYRVLFVAPWRSGQDQLKPDDLLDVVFTFGYTGIRWHDAANSVLFTARWSGNDFARLDVDDPIVIYVALYDEGRVAARRLDEFEEHIHVPCDDGGHPHVVPRFERIGE